MSASWQRLAEPEFQLRLSVFLGMVTFQCLLAIWVATSQRHWFWRALALWAGIMLLVPIRAWEPAWMFGLSSPLIVGFIALGRLWQSPATTASAAPSAEPLNNRWRFSLLDLLLLMAITGLWIHGTQIVVRQYQPRNWLGWLACSFSLAALSAVAYACARGPKRWLDVALLCAALAEFEFAFGLGYPFFGIIAAGAALVAYACAFDRRHWVAMALLACVVPGTAALVCWAGVWMRHWDPLAVVGGAGSSWDKTIALAILGAEVVSLLIIVLGLVRAVRTPQLWLPWRIIVAGALTGLLSVSVLGVGSVYLRLLARTLPLTPVATLSVPNNRYDRIQELARAIGALHPAANWRTPTARPSAQSAQTLGDFYQELFSLLANENAVPYEAERDANISYANGTQPKWSVIRELSQVLQAEADWAREEGRLNESVDFALAHVRLGDMLGRGGVATDYAFGSVFRIRAQRHLVKLRSAFPIERWEQAMATLQRSLDQREDLSAFVARQADYEEKAYGWSRRLQVLLDNDPADYASETQNSLLWSQCEMTTNGLLQADLAIRQFRRAAGRLPNGLAELVPRYLPVVPTDPFGQPLRYRVAGDDFVLYSIGWDRTDDGGKFGKFGEYLNTRPEFNPHPRPLPTLDFDLETFWRE